MLMFQSKKIFDAAKLFHNEHMLHFSLQVEVVHQIVIFVNFFLLFAAAGPC